MLRKANWVLKCFKKRMRKRGGGESCRVQMPALMNLPFLDVAAGQPPLETKTQRDSEQPLSTNVFLYRLVLYE